MRKYRLKRLKNSQKSPQKAFANVQVKGKALKKVLNALPKDLVQQKDVLVSILNDFSGENTQLRCVINGNKILRQEEILKYCSIFLPR
jgi:RecG-like helicase